MACVLEIRLKDNLSGTDTRNGNLQVEQGTVWIVYKMTSVQARLKGEIIQ